MGKIMIVNGSPRAPRSNSKRYAALLKEALGPGMEYVEYNVTQMQHEKACRSLQESGCGDLVFVFPLYVDSVPVTLLHFLNCLEGFPLKENEKPAVHVIVNCGFQEPGQNRPAVEILRLFCRENGYPFGCVLCIGSGEAILDTPFVFLIKRKLKKFAAALLAGKAVEMKTTMPLPKRAFIRASVSYWRRYGEKFGVSEEKMDTMEIEG